MHSHKFSHLIAAQPKWLLFKGQPVVKAGDITDRLLWIEKGELRRTHDGMLYTKESFAEIATFFCSQSYQSELVCVSNAEIRVFSRSDVRRSFSLDENPKLNKLLMLVAFEKFSTDQFNLRQAGGYAKAICS